MSSHQLGALTERQTSPVTLHHQFFFDPHSCYTVLSLLFVPVASCGIPCDKLEEKETGVYLIIVLCDPQALSRRGQSLSGAFLKQCHEGKSLQCMETWAVPLVVYLAWREKWPHMRLYTESQAIANSLVGWWGIWPSNVIGKLMASKSRWEVCRQTSLKKMWRLFVSCLNSHHRVTLADNFNNQVGRKTHSVAVSQPLSTAKPCHHPTGWQTKWFGGRDRGYARAQ
jgi:hypothetical protein